NKKPIIKKTKQIKPIIKKTKPKPIKKKKVKRKPKKISFKIPTSLNNKQQINKRIFICRQLIKKKQLKEAKKYLRDIKSKLKKIKLDEISKNILKEELMIVDNDIKLKSLDMR
ncbi:MAG: hypothetical protein U9R08_07285, partial [Nanoarchaeota archaeon]|nr:hypothetical protein [Nanoarchaeota archaeon]